MIPALVNYNLRADPLLHSITVAKCRAIVFSSELAGVRNLIERIRILVFSLRCGFGNAAVVGKGTTLFIAKTSATINGRKGLNIYSIRANIQDPDSR